MTHFIGSGTESACNYYLRAHVYYGTVHDSQVRELLAQEILSGRLIHLPPIRKNQIMSFSGLSVKINNILLNEIH